MKSFNNGAVASAASAVVSGTGNAVVVRQPPRVGRAVRLHNALYRLAGELGMAELVLPSAAMRLDARQANAPANSDAMVTAHAGQAFCPGNSAPREWASRVGELTRIGGALLDFLTVQRDRVDKNFMINEEGHIRLIDHDFSLGHRNPFADGNVSRFYPGKGLAYASKQDSFADLPSRYHAIIEHISAMAPAAVAREFRTTDQEAAVLRDRARLVQEHGLTGAILRTPPTLFKADAWPIQSNDNGYLRQGGAVVARRGQARPGHMTFGPYFTYPPGHYEVTFTLKSAAPVGEMAHLDLFDRGQNLSERRVQASEFTNGSTQVTLIARVDDPANRLEFRTWWHGTADMEVSDISIKSIRVAREFSSNGADMLCNDHGYVKRDGIVSAVRGRSTPGHMTFGPYERFEPGEYDVEFKLRTPAGARGRAATLDVFDSRSQKILASKEVRSESLQAGAWTSIRVRTKLTDPRNSLEFRTLWSGAVDLDVASVTARRVE